MIKEHNYIPRTAKILERYSLSDTAISLRLAMTDKLSFTFLPGQFVMLSVLGFGEIPIGITTSPNEKGYFEVAINCIGMVSKKIASLKKGDVIGVSGPFGNGYPISGMKGKDVVIMAGGIGIFPLRSLIHHIKLNKGLVKSLTILYGARTPDNLCFRDEYVEWEKFSSVNLTVDKPDAAWNGCAGDIAKLYDRVEVKRGSVMIVCGPPAMYKSVIDLYAGKRVAETDLFFMLERRMKCGIGKCQHCTCGKYYVCLDGPVFPYTKLKYNEEAFK